MDSWNGQGQNSQIVIKRERYRKMLKDRQNEGGRKMNWIKIDGLRETEKKREKDWDKERERARAKETDRHRCCRQTDVHRGEKRYHHDQHYPTPEVTAVKPKPNSGQHIQHTSSCCLSLSPPIRCGDDLSA